MMEIKKMTVKTDDIIVINDFAEMRRVILFTTDNYLEFDVSYNIRVNDRTITDARGFLE